MKAYKCSNEGGWFVAADACALMALAGSLVLLDAREMLALQKCLIVRLTT
ncbi:MAG: hypothetical protein EDM05_60615 [Leptolyngbya sp. IPPAS B-1204]